MPEYDPRALYEKLVLDGFPGRPVLDHRPAQAGEFPQSLSPDFDPGEGGALSAPAMSTGCSRMRASFAAGPRSRRRSRARNCGWRSRRRKPAASRDLDLETCRWSSPKINRFKSKGPGAGPDGDELKSLARDLKATRVQILRPCDRLTPSPRPSAWSMIISSRVFAMPNAPRMAKKCSNRGPDSVCIRHEA